MSRFKFEYHTEEERTNILEVNSNLIWIEEQNITEGNFLIFSDEPIPVEVVYVNVPQVELQKIKEDISLMQSALDDVILNGGVL